MKGSSKQFLHTKKFAVLQANILEFNSRNEGASNFQPTSMGVLSAYLGKWADVQSQLPDYINTVDLGTSGSCHSSTSPDDMWFHRD